MDGGLLQDACLCKSRARRGCVVGDTGGRWCVVGDTVAQRGARMGARRVNEYSRLGRTLQWTETITLRSYSHGATVDE